MTDPRLAILTVLAFALVAALTSDLAGLCVALSLAILAAILQKPPLGTLFNALAHVEAILAVVVLTLPFTVPGDRILDLGLLAASEAGLRLAAGLLLKVTAVAILVVAVIGPLETGGVARGLAGLGAPMRLTALLSLAGRYAPLVPRELARLQTALKARGFTARGGSHTWRTYGYLVGMLLARGFERAERVHRAMRARGWHEALPLTPLPAPPCRDWALAGLWAAGLGLVVGTAWR